MWLLLRMLLLVSAVVAVTGLLQERNKGLDEGLAKARWRRQIGSTASLPLLSALPRSVASMHSLQDMLTVTTLPPGTPSYKPTPTPVLPTSQSQSVALMYSPQESCTTASPPISLQRTSSYRPTPTPYPQDCSVGQLIRHLNESNRIDGSRGTYFLPDEVSCNGRLVSVHTCFFYNDGGNNSNNDFRLRVGVFRRVGDDYTRDDNWTNIDVTRQNSSETWGCKSINLTLPVLVGDRIAVRLRNQCQMQRQMRCPLLPILNTTRSTSVVFIRSDDDTIPVRRFSAAQSYTNVHIDVSVSILVLTSQQTSSPLSTSSPTVTGGLAAGDITGIVIAAVVFVILHLILIGVIVYYIRLRSKNQKSTNIVHENNNTSDGDWQAEYHQVERSQSYAQPLDAITPKDSIQSNTVSQENDRRRFLKRGYSDINSYSVIDGEVETNLSHEACLISNPSSHSPNGVAPYNSKYAYAEPYAHANATTSNPPPPGNMSGHYEVDEDYGDPYWHPSSMEDELRMQLMNLKVQEIPREDLQLQEYLGSGQFGTVNRGVWSPSPSSSSPGVEVAVKSLEGEPTEEERVKFLQEAAIMGQFKHPNIIRIVGVVTTSEPLLIVCELMRKGDLHHYLLSLHPQSGSSLPPEMPAILLSFSRQIAAGMGYLAGKSFVHRDLAARNILVSKNDICKIADFGLSRDLQNTDYYVSHGGKIPVKWTAPEALNYRKYSTASDVWSYGVLLYEIWAMGIKPFQDCTNNEALQKVLKGYRLPPPPGCPKQVYELMVKCWHPDPDSRPAFCDLLLPLQRPDFQLLRWSEEDEATFSKEARTLGGPLEDGEELYAELQTVFSNSGSNATI